jgi:farnesyl-diphosphate farnesyltransferase
VKEFGDRLDEGFVACQRHEGERVLMKNSAHCIGWLNSVPNEQQELIRALIEKITEGQRWDLERFDGEGVTRLGTDEELERYAYLVAGCVGEFWTDLGFQVDRDYSDVSRDELREAGRKFGMGLQLVNILRDVPEDLLKGRCYLPGDGGTDPEELLAAMAPWLGKAEGWMMEGLGYAGLVRGRRMRFASGLPALIGRRTLAALKSATWEDLVARVKVSRPEVRECAWQAFVASLAPGPDRWVAGPRRSPAQRRG